MRYVGASPTSFGEDRKKYVVGSGGVNAGDTTFNVSYDEGKVDAYLNGIRLFPDTDFTRTASGVGSNIQLSSGVSAGDVLELFGLQGVHGGNGLVEDRFVVGTNSTGSGGSYSGSTTVFPTASNVGDTVSLWKNGVKLVLTTDYTVQPNASTVTLESGSAATTDDEICIQVVGIVTSANFIPTTDLLDEDNFATNSATKPASQQSIKAYVDAADALKANVANTNMTGDATGVNLTLSGNLTVNGSTVTADTTNTVIKDNLIGLNNGVTSNANDAGLIIERGSTGNDALIMWDESADKWTLGTSTSTASSTGNLNITVGTLVANLEGDADVSGGTLTTSTAQKTAIVDGGKGNLTKSDVGLSNVTNDAQVPASGGTFTGDISVSNSSDSVFTMTVGGTSNDAKIDFNNGSSVDGGITYDHNGSYASEKLVLRAGNNTPHVYLTGNGFVGINQDGPTSHLQVKGYVGFERISGASDKWLAYTNTDDSFRINYNGAGNDELIIDTSGNVEVKTGNLVIGTAGKGIDFSANTDDETGAGSVTGEILDDYEYGTWNPVFSNGTITYAMHSDTRGKYVKIGQMVFVSGYVRNNTNMSNSGNYNAALRINGLPFTPSSSDFGGRGGLSVGYYDCAALQDGGPPTCAIWEGLNYIALYESGGNASGTLSVGDFGGTSTYHYMFFSGTYYTD
tara:strand:- start:298 stop:2346 length:2049 start_codon:yes stop_codon:yes gene_type:complete